MLQYEKQTEQKQKVYRYEKAVERYSICPFTFKWDRLTELGLGPDVQFLPICCRMLAVNPNLSPQSVHHLLDRGLAQVEGGLSVVFSRH